MKTLQCEMSKECHEPVTHIEEKGFIYCEGHARTRRQYGRHARKMRTWELKLIHAGFPLPSYEPIPKPDVQVHFRCRATRREVASI